jgi:hypothetical protein
MYCQALWYIYTFCPLQNGGVPGATWEHQDRETKERNWSRTIFVCSEHIFCSGAVCFVIDCRWEVIYKVSSSWRIGQLI